MRLREVASRSAAEIHQRQREERAHGPVEFITFTSQFFSKKVCSFRGIAEIAQ